MRDRKNRAEAWGTRQLDQLRTVVKATLILLLRLQTSSGAWVSSTSIEPLNDERLPDGVTRIEFDSAFLFKSQFNNLIPNNSFLVVIDLLRPSVLDMAPEPAPNASVATISGTDSTWVNSLWDELSTFFRDRKTPRAWLHSRQSYTALLIPVGFPLSLDLLSHIEPLFERKLALNEPLSVAVDVYVVLVALLLFRIAFNYARWAFPKLELDAPRQHAGTAHRLAIKALAVMIIGILLKALFKLFGIG